MKLKSRCSCLFSTLWHDRPRALKHLNKRVHPGLPMSAAGRRSHYRELSSFIRRRRVYHYHPDHVDAFESPS